MPSTRAENQNDNVGLSRIGGGVGVSRGGVVVSGVIEATSSRNYSGLWSIPIGDEQPPEPSRGTAACAIAADGRLAMSSGRAPHRHSRELGDPRRTAVPISR